MRALVSSMRRNRYRLANMKKKTPAPGWSGLLSFAISMWGAQLRAQRRVGMRGLYLRALPQHW